MRGQHKEFNKTSAVTLAATQATHLLPRVIERLPQLIVTDEIVATVTCMEGAESLSATYLTIYPASPKPQRLHR